MSEKVKILFDHIWDYLITPENAIGATESLTLRTAETPSGDIAYVRKFGKDYIITEVDACNDPVDPNMTYRFYALDGTLLGSRVGGGGYVQGATVSGQGCYMEIEASGGDVTVIASYTFSTDVDPGGKTFVCAAETVQDGNTLRLYLSDTTSTYYDGDYKYGGARHTPVLDDSDLPYFEPVTAYAALDSANDGVEVLDSETYDLELDLDRATTFMYATLGQTPTLTRGIGARVTREVEHDGNNTDTAYVSSTGDDATGIGSYQNPYKTVSTANGALAGRTYINIMDSGNFTETNTTLNALTLEPIYGMIPTISPLAATTDIFIISDVATNIYGISFNGRNLSDAILSIEVNAFAGIISDNTFYGSILYGIYEQDLTGNIGTIRKNRIYNIPSGIFLQTVIGKVINAKIEYNIIYDCSTYGILVWGGAGGGDSSDFDATNNLIYTCGIGIYFLTNIYPGNIENNTITSNTIGIQSGVSATFTGNVRNNIVFDNTTDLKKFAGIAITITESDYLVNDGWTIGAGNITTDPIFADTSDNKYGICLDSGAWKTDSNTDDMGAHLRIIEIGANDIVINGFIIDGNEQFNNGIWESTTRTGTILKWCTIKDFNGKAVDFYAVADTNCVVNNCELYNNGDGLSFAYGGNSIEENIIKNNLQAGIYLDYINHNLDHNIVYLNSYGIYINSNGSGVVIKNSIIHNNSAYGIYSEINITITYNCITDATNKVAISDNNNITDNPLFVDLTFGSEDFHLKTIARDNVKESPCLNAADDGYDMGAYLETRVITDESYTKFDLPYNPSHIDDDNLIRGSSKKVSAFASTYSFAKGRKRVLPFAFSDDDYITKTEWLTFQYLAGLMQTKDNLLTREKCLVRISLKPLTFMDSGTSATIDATGKTITDINKSLVKDEHSGYWAGIRFDDAANSVVNAAAKKITVSGKSWNDDQWNGYYYMYHGNPLLILDTLNSEDIYVSDKNGILEDETYSTYIEAYFEVLTNIATVLTLDDPYSLLIDGSYDYYIDFIECLVTSTSFRPKPPGFNPNKQHWKTGFNITFEQK